MRERNTIQRRLVLNALNQFKGHATADEIYHIVSREHPNISRGTVYRNLQRLCDMGEIRKVEVPSGADCYDHMLTAHYHVRCEQCGRVFDVDMAYMPELECSIRDRQGFVLTGHSIMFSGICPECQKKQDTE
ncbi:Fur family transcriptional regulator [Christensenella tenuis]|jgi:Fe2+ or Zn2+ uptake regulation protein|uniref:Transcriptional repressor n=1 Tax=Christensenella tenuis TaxID=2763033 RepID=A0ABR7EI37_9FIRM|nr:transcriptional repressor [Christensenella tenuis]MBC5649413.1 transcriptional repressor [Christensenella tenuis]